MDVGKMVGEREGQLKSSAVRQRGWREVGK